MTQGSTPPELPIRVPDWPKPETRGWDRFWGRLTEAMESPAEQGKGQG